MSRTGPPISRRPRPFGRCGPGPGSTRGQRGSTCASAGLPGGSDRSGSSPYSPSALVAASGPEGLWLAGPGPRSRPGARRGRRPSPRPIGRAWSSPTTAGSGWDTPSRPWGRSTRLGSGIWPGPREARLLAATGDSRPGLPPRGRSRRALDRALRRGRLAGAVPGRRARTGRSSPAPGRTARSSNLTDPKHPASRPDPKVQYIWDLAADPQGNLYAATGPDRPALEAVARGPMVAALRQQVDPPALRGRRAGRHRSTRAATAKGLIYRVGPDGKATILFDAPAVGGPHPAGRRRRRRSTRGRRPRPAARAAARNSLFLTRADSSRSQTGRSRPGLRRARR